MQMNDLIADTKRAIAEYEQAAELVRGVILGQGFVVRCEGVYVSFDIDAAGLVKNPRPSQPHQATRFTRADAALVAATVKNGSGTAGEIVHVRDAIDAVLANQRDLLAVLQAHENQAAGQSFDLKG